jgi:putative 2OG-Fe(II) oxygenase
MKTIFLVSNCQELWIKDAKTHFAIDPFIVHVLEREGRSMAGDSGLYLHQDGVGLVNLCICLDNNPNGDGATAVLPGSHLLEKSAKKLRLEITPFLFNTFRFLFKPLCFMEGDVSFFSNPVWHGRFSN